MLVLMTALVWVQVIAVELVVALAVVLWGVGALRRWQHSSWRWLKLGNAVSEVWHSLLPVFEAVGLLGRDTDLPTGYMVGVLGDHFCAAAFRVLRGLAS